MNSKRKFFYLTIFISLSLFFAFFSSYFGLSQDYLTNLISKYSEYSAIIFVSLFSILATFSFSISIINTIGALFFNPYQAIVYTMMVIMISSIFDFFIAKKLGRKYIQNYIDKRGGRIEKFDDILEKDTFKTILILSAVFFVPATVPNLLGGVIKINFRNYFIATFIGNVPNAVFTIYLVRGIFYSNIMQIYLCIIGIIITTLVALFFYKGEVKNILILSFPFLFKR